MSVFIRILLGLLSEIDNGLHNILTGGYNESA